MPTPIQTLSLANAMTRLFRLAGKRKLEADETVVPTFGMNASAAPWLADGAVLWEGYSIVGAAVGFVSQAGVANPGRRQGVMVVDSFTLIPVAAGQNIYASISANNVTTGTQTINVSRPFADLIAGAPLLARCPPLLVTDNTSAAYGERFRLGVAPGSNELTVVGPWVFPGIEEYETLWVRTTVVDTDLSVAFRGRWYPHVPFIGP